jgi:hypothetical protein
MATSDELYDLFRSDVVDTVRPYLWSDEEVYVYMNDAYFMFVRLTGGISDFSSDATQITALNGEPTSEVSDKILRFRQASLVATGEDVSIINAQDVHTLTDEDYGVLRRLNLPSTVGKVRYMVTGEQDSLVSWYPIPDQDYTVRFLLERLPLSTITDGGQSFTGVAEHHHYHFLKWMKGLAYRKQDAETFDMTRANQEQSDFMAYCSLSKGEKERYKHKPRVVRYGGI